MSGTQAAHPHRTETPEALPHAAEVGQAGGATPAAAPATPAAPPPAWATHPDGPFVGIKAWAEGEFARLEAMIKADMPKGMSGTSVTQPSVTQPSITQPSVTQPSEAMPNPNMGGTKE